MSYDLKELQSKTATELRKIVYNEGNYKGRTSDIRNLSKDQHVHMLMNDVHLDTMLEADEQGVPYPNFDWTADDNTDSDTSTVKATEPDNSDEPRKPNVTKTGDSLTDTIISALLENVDFSPLFSPEKIEKQIHEKVLKEIETVRRVSIQVDTPDTSTNVGVQHEDFEKLLNVSATRTNSMLVGPSGSGKTHAASAMAKALDLPFYAISVGQQSSKIDFLGYMDANGNYQRSHFREAFENGGVFLIDEIDSGNANIITTINAATSNHVCAFPDKMVERHEDCIFVAAANTYGRGADRQYVGRNQLDAATLDRFAVMTWDYDEKLELELAPNQKFGKKVQKIREIVFEREIRMVVSPRASIKGGTLLEAGFSEEEVLDMLVFKGVDQATKETILNRL